VVRITRHSEPFSRNTPGTTNYLVAIILMLYRWQAFVNASTAEKQYRNTMIASACNDINCLRSLSETQLVTIQQVVMNNSYQQPPYVDGDYYFGPSVDGVFIREHPNTAYKNGRFYKVPFLVDHNEWEGVAFSRQINSSAQIIPDEESFFTGRGPSFFGKLFALYPASAYNSSFWQRVDWFSDVVVDCMSPFGDRY
jgi:carboxylesterase type B